MKIKGWYLLVNNLSPVYWDNHWDLDNLEKTIQSVSRYNKVMRTVTKYLSREDGPLLEAGCGIGQHVFAFGREGYRCIGVDYAAKNIAKIKMCIPEIDVRCQDIRRLEFDDGYFAGVCSLGVIEHFIDGYEDLLLEMKRVIKPGGYLFLSFPYMSPVRRMKARLGRYPAFDSTVSHVDFWQFAFSHKQVISDLNKMGFKCVSSRPIAGLKGFTDEIGWAKNFIRHVRDYSGRSFAVRIFRVVLGDALALISGHMIMLVMRLEEN